MPSDTNPATYRGYIIPIGGAIDKTHQKDILSRFSTLCGGHDSKILVIPTASELASTGPEYVEIFESMGGKAESIPIDQREDCFEERILSKLQRASGIFITGGNQLRLSTILGGTPAAKLIRNLSASGIPVAGTSAGAAIMPEHMIAGGRSGPTPREDGVTMAPGLGLTNKIVVDQHFKQRDRIGRLMTALSYNPFVSGIGIDENTAAFIAPGGVLEVVGSGAITVLDPAELNHSSMATAGRRDPICLVGMKLHILTAGAKYNIDTREVSF